MIVYFNGEYMEKTRVSISPDDRGFLFADGVYEVIRVYQRMLFLPHAHLERLQRSLAGIRVEYLGVDELLTVGRKLVELNDVSEAFYYIQITRGAAPRYHGFPPPGTKPTVYAALTPISAPNAKIADGISAITVSDARWGRCDIKSVSLLPNVLAYQRAADRGAEEVLFLRNGVVTEGSHNSLFAVFDGVVTTAPLSNAILPSITRGVIIELCTKIGLAVKEEVIPEEKILDADEWFVSGTGSEVTPVIRINEHVIGSGLPGPISRTLFEEFRRYVQGSLV